MADKDRRGEHLAEKVRQAEERLGRVMSGPVSDRELESARRQHRDAQHNYQAHHDGRAYGFGVREK